MQRRSHDIEDYKAILLEVAEKLYVNMAKRMVCELVNELVSKTSTAASSSMLPLEEKQEQ
jgi:hypothetical protein